MGKSTFTQTITITTASTTRKTIKIVVKPTSTTGTPYTIGADSLTFDRANPPGTPLCSGC
jgi:hypothetical protein